MQVQSVFSTPLDVPAVSIMDHRGSCQTVVLEPQCDRLTWESLSARKAPDPIVARSAEGTCGCK